MAMTTTNITSDGTTLIATINQKAKSQSDSKIGIHAHGTFGSGTITFQYSLDGGTTKVTLKDGASTSAADISYTASGGFNWDSPSSTGGASILYYAVLAGSTSPNLNIYVIDQNFG